MLFSSKDYRKNENFVKGLEKHPKISSKDREKKM